jgi:hypothetical protein
MTPNDPTTFQKIRSIAAVVAAHAGLDLQELIGETRLLPVTRARHLAMWVAARKLGVGPAAIGRAFNRDHTSVSAALKAIGRHLQREPSLVAVRDASIRSIEAGNAVELVKRARRSAQASEAERQERERKQTIDAAYVPIQIGERYVTRDELARQHQRFAQAMRVAGYAHLERQSA